ncbi:kinesin-like protein Klp8 [Orbilia brochopaga]|uniref:Kinesin-like protein Klp8 n=1 Tax=Orbilia brochopaga TaxID=3140254 RepID=A0AAV9U6S7_9PEZI
MSAGNIKVVVRVRPFNSREKDRNAKCIVQMKGSQTILTPPPGASDNAARKGNAGLAKADGPKVFNFDRSYWSFDRSDSHYAGQDDLFKDLGGPLLDNAFQGYNNCIFAYGQTGSGKSYSMMGYGEEYGIIPKICQSIFERITSEKDPNIVSTVEVSYLEIYNEKVRDLLNPSNKGALKVREHPSLGPYVEDLAKLVVTSFREIENLMDEGNKARTVAATNMNETSSRSHAVFTLILTQKRHDVETGFDTEKVSRISLVDLAGSERATSTGATGARLKEGAEINRSLSTLGRVIAALADLSSGKKKKDALVPYRDSVLTWLLKDSLGGNSMTAMIAAISPADINWDETLSTLRYADSAKRIKNHAVVNEDPNARMIRELKEELAQLRQKLSGGGGGEEEHYDASVPLEKQIVTITGSDGAVRKVSKAEIAEQLGASEKLLKEVNQTWEEKLEMTQQIQKEREAALEELGISIEKDFIGMSMPKRIPHLVNLSDDPLLAECLVYNIKPGDTTVGNVESATTAQIKLNGSKILPDHCRFENVNDVVTLVPNEGAAVMVNGLRIEGPKRLRTGFRVILGDFHIFRFNHPNEARAERDKLHRQSLASSIADHRHTNSNGFIEGAGSDAESSRPDSPALVPPMNKEIDWSFAQREALMAQGLDPVKINGMTDEELNALLQGVQKAYNLRKGKLEDDDADSITSFTGPRERYTSNGTIDNFSLDTSLTVPSTPQRGEEEEDRYQQLKEELQTQLRAQKEQYQERLKVAEESNAEVEEVRAQKVQMEEEFKAAKVMMEARLEEQKKEFERKQQEMEIKLEEMTLSPQVRSRNPTRTPSPAAGALLTKRQKNLARAAAQLWRRSNYVRMAETVLQYAATLKEAQIMSNEMEKRVFFQFTILDVGHTCVSTYDLLLNGVNADDDEALEMAPKPCVAVRAMDFNRNLIHLWSLEKLQHRIRQMKQIYQYLSRPEYLQHVQGSDPFSEPILPDYTLLGDSDVPLAAIFQSKRQQLDLEVISPHTCSVIGIVKVTLEPSTVEVPKGNIGFNVIIHQLLGISEREGTDIHAQLFLPWLNNAPATNPIRGFDEGPVNFESTHVLTAPLNARIKAPMLRIGIFGKVTGMHLERLMSWDEMRDQPDQHRTGMRLHENEFYTEEKHDLFSKVQMLELQETGEYTPVDVIQVSESDQGSFQLHHGVQRRIQVWLTHSSGETLPMKDISRMTVRDVSLVEENGQPKEPSSTKEVELRIVKGPSIRHNPDGTSSIGVLAQWDTSAHNSVLLDRMTAPKYRVQVTLSWELVSERLAETLRFQHNVALEIRSRLVRSPSKFLQIISATRTVHAIAGMFQVTVKPAVSRRAGDLWRMNSRQRYVKGEEVLRSWTPRGISILKDYLAARRRRMRVAEVEAIKPFLKPENSSDDADASAGTETPVKVVNGGPEEEGDGENKEEEELSAEKKAVIEKFLKLWPRGGDPLERILSKQNYEPPQDGPPAATRQQDAESEPLKLVAESIHIPKNPKLQRSGYVFRPNEAAKKWEKQYLELRKPYLHIHNGATGEEIMAVNLTDCTVDYEPSNGMAELMARDNVFAIYAPQSSYRFATKTEKEKMDWVMAVDSSYFAGTAGRNPR